MLFKSKIFRKLLIPFLLLSTVPLIIALLIILHNKDTALRQKIYHELEMTVASAENQVLSYLYYLKARTQDFASDGFIRDATEMIMDSTGDVTTIVQSLNNHLAVNKKPLVRELTETFVIDLNGRVIASSDSLAIGYDYSQTDFFLNGKDTTYVSDVFIDPYTGEKTWIVTTPIFSRDEKKLIGVLANRIDPQTLTDVVSGHRAMDMGADIQILRFGETGETYIVNKKGMMITESRFAKDTSVEKIVDTELVQMALRQGKEMTGDYLNYLGKEISGASRIIEHPYWIILAEMDYSEAFLPVTELRNLSLILIGFFILGIFIVTVILAKGFIKPIEKLNKANRAMIEGDHEAAYIPEDEIPDDEIGDVIRNRNDMLKKLEKLSEESLNKEKKHFEELINSLDGIVWEAKPDDYKFTFVSKRAESLFGYPVQKWMEEPNFWINHIHPDDRDFCIDFCRNSIRQKKNHSFEYRFITSDNRTVWLKDIVTLVFEDGEVTKLRGLMVDITERKLAEEEIRKSEERYRNLVESIPGVVYSYSDKRGGLYYSSQVESLLGYSPSYLYDHPHTWHDSIHPEDLEKVDQAIKSAVETKSFDIEYRIKDNYGKWHWFRDRLINAQKANGEIIINGLAIDVTNRKSAELELRRSFDRQKVINSLLSISLSGVELDDILDQALEAVLSIPWLSFQSQGCIFLIENDPNVLVMKATRGLNNQCRTECAQLPVGKCLCGLAASTGEIQYSDHIDERHEIYFDDMSPHGHYCVPILHEDNTIGVINIYLKEGHPRDETEEEFLTAIANTLAGIITRKRNEEELIKLSTAVEQSDDLILITDTKGIIEYVNPAFERLTGYSKEEVIGKTPAILKSSKHDSLFYKKLWETILSGKVFRAVFINKKKSGELYFSENTITPIKDSHGKISRFVATAKDITERIKMEEALKESEKKYRTLFEDSKETIFISTPEGRLIDINPAGVELFGYSSKEEILNTWIDKDHYVNFADRKRYLQMMERYGFVRDFEFRLKKKNGEELIVLETSTALRDEDGKIVAYRGIIRDITKERKLQEQLIQSQKMEAMGVLAGGIAHDFNNILTTIMANAQLGLMEISPDNPLYRYFADIEKTSHRAANLTKQILAFSRKQTLEPRVVELNELIKDFSRMLKRLIGENIEAKIKTTEKPCPVLADPNALEQVLMNLAVNAKDAMPEGGTYTISTERIISDEQLLQENRELQEQEYVLITFQDTGTGIPEKILPRIFEPFFTTKETDKGTGLGLSVVHGIIKQHNGVIDVKSTLNEGTTFRIFLPITEEQQEIAKEKSKKDIPRGIETILFAEDEPHLRRVARQSLESLGYTVLLAEDGKKAVELFNKHKGKIDLVILDIVMPRLSGRDAYFEIQKLSPDTPVLFITGYSDIIKKLQKEVKDINLLYKPYTIESLGVKIREILDKH